MKIYIACTVLLLGLLLLLGLHWYYSLAYVDAIKQRAKAAGLPVTFEELYPDETDLEGMHELKAIVDLIEAEVFCFTYYVEKEEIDVSEATVFPGFGGEWSIHPGVELHQLTKDYYNRADQIALVERLQGMINDLKNHSLYLNGVDYRSPMYNSGLGELSVLSIYLSEYALTGDKDRFQEIVHMLLDLCSIVPSRSTIDVRERADIFRMVIEVCSQHLDYTDESIHNRMILECNELEMLIEKSHVYSLVNLLFHSDQLIKWYGNISKGRWKEYIAVRLAFPWVYEKYLEQCIVAQQDGLQTHEIYLLNQQWATEIKLNWALRYSGSKSWLYTGKQIEGLYRLRMHSDLLRAEKNGKEWPIDVFDPKGGRLRPVEKDGKVIGAYSIGSDGIDDGPQDESVFWLYDYIEY